MIYSLLFLPFSMGSTIVEFEVVVISEAASDAAPDTASTSSPAVPPSIAMMASSISTQLEDPSSPLRTGILGQVLSEAQLTEVKEPVVTTTTKKVSRVTTLEIIGGVGEEDGEGGVDLMPYYLAATFVFFSISLFVLQRRRVAKREKQHDAERLSSASPEYFGRRLIKGQSESQELEGPFGPGMRRRSSRLRSLEEIEAELRGEGRGEHEREAKVDPNDGVAAWLWRGLTSNFVVDGKEEDIARLNSEDAVRKFEEFEPSELFSNIAGPLQEGEPQMKSDLALAEPMDGAGDPGEERRDQTEVIASPDVKGEAVQGEDPSLSPSSPPGFLSLAFQEIPPDQVNLAQVSPDVPAVDLEGMQSSSESLPRSSQLEVPTFASRQSIPPSPPPVPPPLSPPPPDLAGTTNREEA